MPIYFALEQESGDAAVAKIYLRAVARDEVSCG